MEVLSEPRLQEEHNQAWQGRATALAEGMVVPSTPDL